MLARVPVEPLRAFVSLLWASDEPASAGRERVLPTGGMHLVIRLDDAPLRVFDDERDASGRVVGNAVVGGARAEAYVKDVGRRTRSVGAMLRPGAATLLLGAPAGELAGRHTPLEELWGADADRARERLLETTSPAAALDRFEALLRGRLRRLRGLHPAIAHALRRLDEGAAVGAVVGETGYSHRHFVALFRESVGLAPKLWVRVTRFSRLLERLGDPKVTLADVALEAGYADQSHFNRDFREHAGLSPARYRALAPGRAHHVQVNSVQDRRGGKR